MNARRIEMEKEIIVTVAEDLLAAGFNLKVDDGGEIEEDVEQTPEAVLDAVTSVDAAVIFAYRKGHCIGCVDFILGNDGYDVVADYSVVLEPHLRRAEELSEQFVKELYV